jgi:hypothetical protein
MFKVFALGTIASFVALIVVIAIVAFITTRNRDLTIPDTAIEFQMAVFGGNYEALWDLSSPEYRAGRSRDEFIDWARFNVPQPDRLFNWTVLNEREGDIARAHVLVQLASGGTATTLILLRKIDGDWRITAYENYEGAWPPDEPPLAGS